MPEKCEKVHLYLRDYILDIYSPKEKEEKMAHQLQKQQTIILLLVLLALIVLVVAAVAMNINTNGDIIAMAIDGPGGGVSAAFEHNISPWGIDANRVIDSSLWSLRL